MGITIRGLSSFTLLKLNDQPSKPMPGGAGLAGAGDGFESTLGPVVPGVFGSVPRVETPPDPIDVSSLKPSTVATRAMSSLPATSFD